MSGPGIFLETSRAGKEVHETVLRFAITGAVTQSPRPIDDSRALNGFGAAAFTQAIIDAHLGTTSEFTAAQFDATSLGADAQGVVVDMGGQVEELISMTGRCYSATAGLTLIEVAVEDSSTLTDSTLITECAKGASGNVGIKIDWTSSPDFDGLTAGLVEIKFNWRSK